MKLKHKFALGIFFTGISIIGLSSIIYYYHFIQVATNRHLAIIQKETAIVAVHIDNLLMEKVKTATTLGHAPILKKFLSKSNNEFEQMDAAERKKRIADLNDRWMQTEEVSHPFVQKYLSNPPSRNLEQQQIRFPGEYGEIFLTNKYGALVASTAKLTTLAHSHKYWWKAAFNEGNGAVFFDDRGYDDSVGDYVLGVVIPVKQGKEITGILKCNLKILGAISNILLFSQKQDPGDIKLARSGGLIIYEKGKKPLVSNVERSVLGKLNERAGGSILLNNNEQKRFVGFSTVKITTGEISGYDFGGNESSIDHKKGNKGEIWYVIKSRPLATVQSLVKNTADLLFLIGLGISCILAILSLFMGRKMTRSIQDLVDATKEIGKGRFQNRIDIISRDEIGELAESFNQMTTELKRVTASREDLEREIVLRGKAETDARKTNDTLKLFMDLLPQAAIMIDTGGKILAANTVTKQRILSYDDNVAGKSLFDMIPASLGDNWKRHIEMVLQTGESFYFEEKHHNVYTENYVRPFLDEAGNVIRLAILSIDVTERKQNEDLINKFFDQPMNLHLIARLDGFVQRVNKGWHTTLGYFPDEITGTFFMELIHPDDKAATLEEIEKLTRGETVLYFENRFRHKDGRYRSLAWSAIVSTNENLIYAVASDITDRKKAEKALKDSEKRYHTLFETISDAIYVHDENGRILDVNQMACKRLGYTREEMMKLSAADLDLDYPTEDRVREKISQAFSSGHLNIESRHRTKDSGIVYVELQVSAFEYNDNPLFVTVSRDVTERKQIEQALRNNEERLRNFFNNAPVGIFQSTPEGKYIHFNSRFAEMLGYKTDELAQIPNIADLYKDPTQRDEVKRLLGKYDILEDFHIHLRRKDGQEMWMSIYVQTRRNEKGEILCYDGFTLDITKTKQTQAMLERVRYSIDKITDTILWVDKDGNFIDANDAASQNLGYRYGELMTMEVADIDPGFPKQRWQKHWEEMIQCKMMTLESVHQTKNGRRYPVEVVIHNQKFGDKRYNCVFVRDITERKKMEEELRQAHKMEAIGTLAGGIAHEFNNMLGIIIGNTELALEDIPDWNPVAPNLKEILTASLRAKEVVKKLMSASRKTPALKKPLRIQSIIEESLGLLRKTIPATIDIRTSLQCPAEMILGDPTEINQVLINLCNNSVFAMKEKPGILEVKLECITMDTSQSDRHDDLKSGDYARLTVRDTGDGIGPDIIDRVFDPYFTTKEVDEGLGMGLAVVYGIVKKHEGAIYIESETGKGSIVNVLFPLIETHLIVEERKSEKIPTGSEKILLIDDEVILLKMVTQMIERIGYNVVGKAGSIEALELFKNNSEDFDLVITDMAMPKMSGDILAREIIQIRPDIPIILCTGHSDRIDESRAQDNGIRALITKPFEKKEIAKTIRKVLDGNHQNLHE